MTTWIALLRGVNVGGHNKLPMKELTRELTDAGLDNVRTYIQSGNVVFESGDGDATSLADDIGAAIERHHGFRPFVMLLTADELRAAIAANPYPEATAEPKTLHLNFLGGTPDAGAVEALHALKSESESLSIVGEVLYLHAPDGIGRSKLAARVDKTLGVDATGRNWRTVCKLAEMAARSDLS